MRYGFHLATVVLAFALGAAAAEPGTGAPPPNLAPNASFEQPDTRIGAVPARWDVFSMVFTNIGISTAAHRTGRQAVLVRAQEEAHAVQGLTFHRRVRPGDVYTLILHVKNNPANPMGEFTHGAAVLQWRDHAWGFLSETELSRWDEAISQLRWSRVAVEGAVAPEQATYAVVEIKMMEGEKAGTGSFFVDDVSLIRTDR